MGSVTEGVVSFFKDLLDFNMESEYRYNPTIKDQKSDNNIEKSDFISRDLSWMKFNERVLDQVRKTDLNIFEKLKFMAITASNLDEFMAVRLGSLYNYIDYDKERIDYSGLREVQFRKVLLNQIKKFIDERNRIFREDLEPEFEKNGFRIIKYNNLDDKQLDEVTDFFENTVYPMLTPMVCDHTHAFPNLLAKSLILGIVSIEQQTTLFPETEDNKKLSFVQIPTNLPKFYEFENEDVIDFLPTEEIIRNQIGKLYKNVAIESVDLFRIVRNGDFTIDENDDVDADFVDEVKEKIRSRQAGRVV